MPGTCYQHLAKKFFRHLVAQKLIQIRLPEGAELVSLDNTSLFTMVAVEDATEFAALKANELGLLPDCMTVETFRFLLRLCVKEVLFASRDGRLYRQVDGVARGSALVPYSADLFMAHFDDAIAEGLPLYFRYMDDVKTALPTCNVAELL